MTKKPLFLILAICLTVGATRVLGSDNITKIKLNTYPGSATIKSNGTAILHAEFFGTKKKGILESLLGGPSSGSGKLQSDKWRIEIVSENGGILSKKFLFQEEDQKSKGGWQGLLAKGIGVISAKNAVLYTAPLKPGKYTIRLIEGSLKDEAIITVIAGVPESSENVEFTHEMPEDKYLPIVEHYAPFIAQETWFNPRADYIVRFDYDKNWKGDDNWENLETGSSQAFVYYAVMETQTHWFIHYNLFHPRDYDDSCIAGTCHENDNEGLILTVRKAESEFGKPELMQTLAHNDVFSYSNETMIGDRIHVMNGQLEFFEGSHPIVFVESGGHGVLGSTDGNSLFDASKQDFKSTTGVTYIYDGGRAERPGHGNARNIGYSLLPIEKELWPRGSGAKNSSNETFENFFVYQPFGGRPGASANFIAGSFKGRTASENKAKPFWGWHDNKTNSRNILATGQWALDPAYSISVSLNFPAALPVSTDYIYNPFLRNE